jgi:hypothetical protein
MPASIVELSMRDSDHRVDETNLRVERIHRIVLAVSSLGLIAWLISIVAMRRSVPK